MAKLRMALASTHGARKPPGLIYNCLSRLVCIGTKEAPTSTQPVVPVTTAPVTAALVAATEIPVTAVFAISLTMPHPATSPIPTDTT